MTKAQTHQTVVNVNDEWETPPSILLDKIRELDVHPVIDVFASKNNHKFLKYYTKENSAFWHEINEPFFANPEYSNIEKSSSKSYLGYIEIKDGYVSINDNNPKLKKFVENY